MATKERYQNPVVGDDIILRWSIFNSNNLANFDSIQQVIIYYLDPTERTEDNPTGKRVVDTFTASDVTQTDTGQYYVTASAIQDKYVIGTYIDAWQVTVGGNQTTFKTKFQIYPNLWYASPIPIVYDFNFGFRPNRMRKGSQRWLIIDVIPNVPKASDLERYYENLAIVSPISISIEQACVDCMPQEEDLRLMVDQDSVDFREKQKGFYWLDTTDYPCGIYNIWFTLQFGGSLYISDKEQLQIF